MQSNATQESGTVIVSTLISIFISTIVSPLIPPLIHIIDSALPDRKYSPSQPHSPQSKKKEKENKT